MFASGTQFSEGGTTAVDINADTGTNGCTSHYQLAIDAPIAKEVGAINTAFKLFDTTALAGKTAVSFTDDVAATISSTDFATQISVAPTAVPAEQDTYQLLIPVHQQGAVTTLTAFASKTLLVFKHKEDITAEGNELLGFNLVESTAETTDYYNVSGSAVTENIINDDSLTFTLTAPTGIDEDTNTANILDVSEGASGQTNITYTLAWSGVTNINIRFCNRWYRN